MIRVYYFLFFLKCGRPRASGDDPALPVPTRYQDDRGAIAAGERMLSYHSTAGRKKLVDMARSNISDMIGAVDGMDDMKKILTLDDERLWFLWTSSSKFADTLSEMYFAMKAQEPGYESSSPQFDQAIIDSMDHHYNTVMQMYEEAAK